MMIPITLVLLPVAFFISAVSAREGNFKVVLTNDDGWAVAQIRAQKEALDSAGFDVILSAPTQDNSGSGSLTKTPTTLDRPCQYDSCPTGSPAEGFNQSDPYLNYVNAYPVDSVKYGIQTLAPKLFGSKPDFVISGPNVGYNLGLATKFSGTIGAAAEASLEGIPSVAFSGFSTSHVSYTSLESDPTSQASLASRIYASLTTDFVKNLFGNSTSSILPPDISLNVNYPPIDNCPHVSDFRFVMTRIFWNPFATDIPICGSNILPTETSVIHTPGCYSSVSVFNAKTKHDVDVITQAVVWDRLRNIFTCLPAPSFVAQPDVIE